MCWHIVIPGILAESQRIVFFFGYQTFWVIPRWDWTALVTSFSFEKPTKTIYSHVFDRYICIHIFVYHTSMLPSKPPNAAEECLSSRFEVGEHSLPSKISWFTDPGGRLWPFKTVPWSPHIPKQTNRLEIGREEVEHQKPSPWLLQHWFHWLVEDWLVGYQAKVSNFRPNFRENTTLQLFFALQLGSWGFVTENSAAQGACICFLLGTLDDDIQWTCMCISLELLCKINFCFQVSFCPGIILMFWFLQLQYILWQTKKEKTPPARLSEVLVFTTLTFWE